MFNAIAAEIVARDQPKVSWSGTIRTLGVARTPAAVEQGEKGDPDDDPGVMEPPGGETRYGLHEASEARVTDRSVRSGLT